VGPKDASKAFMTTLDQPFHGLQHRLALKSPPDFPDNTSISLRSRLNGTFKTG